MREYGMPLLGQALVGIWHGIQSGGEDEYLAWHTYEHMPERLGIPGFLRGRRFSNWCLDLHPTFTLYEGAHIPHVRRPACDLEWQQRPGGLDGHLRARLRTPLSVAVS